MQKVSKAYKRSMKSSLRERAYIMLSFGLINQEVQAKSTVGAGNFTYFSDKKIFKNKTKKFVYATMEENFTKVDGTMLFLPRQDVGGWLNTGLISEDLISNEICEIAINFNTVSTNVKGLNIDFGENYPVDFDIKDSNDHVLEIRGNDQSEWKTEEVFINVISLKLIIKKMKNEHSRLRIFSLLFGYGLFYDNDSVIDSNMDTYVSPIGADLPQIDFSVILKNQNHYFDVDNPKSAIHYLETGQEMNVMYGYQLSETEEIEWIHGNSLLCSAWESDDTTATIYCNDVFRNMDQEYVKGFYSAEGKSYWDLTKEILEDAGVIKYYIDPILKKLYTQNPIPRMKHKEALQIIANACRCTLTQSREGKIQIRSNFIPEVSVTTNGETTFSKSSNIKKASVKAEYATMAKNYTKTDGEMFFIPRTGIAELETGYVSSEISNGEGLFENNPIVMFSMEASRSYYGLKIVFGQSLPKQFIVRSYNEGDLVNEYTILNDEIEQKMVILKEFDDCNKITIEFVETEIPYNRITINHFSLNDVADFKMERVDMTSSPKAIKQEIVKEIIVPCFTFQENSKEENLIYENVEAVVNKIETFYLQDPCYGYVVKLNEQSGLADIVEWKNYYITIKYKVSGSYKLEIQGHRYKIIERYAVKTLNARGKTIKWKNPLINSMQMAEDLAAWLADYYKSGIEYEYDTRGNPELDGNDIIYQENEFYDNMRVNVYRHSLKFKQSFSGKVTARRVGG